MPVPRLRPWAKLPSWAIALALIVAACGNGGASVAAPEVPATEADVVVDDQPTAPAEEPAPTAAPTSTPVAEPEPAPTPTLVEEQPDAPAGEGAAEVDSAADEQPDCIRLTDFADDAGWRIVNDGVMGGLSQGRAAVVDGTLVFDGIIVTEGGGFSTVRAGVVPGGLEGVTSLRFRVRSDGRAYELIADDSPRGSVSHFGPLGADGRADWQEVEVAFEALVPRSFGTPVDVEPFRPELAVSIGIILADGVDGPFTLEVDWVDACR